jgi:hypothetical protein
LKIRCNFILLTGDITQKQMFYILIYSYVIFN